jgi:hypothetical protein
MVATKYNQRLNASPNVNPTFDYMFGMIAGNLENANRAHSVQCEAGLPAHTILDTL